MAVHKAMGQEPGLLKADVYHHQPCRWVPRSSLRRQLQAASGGPGQNGLSLELCRCISQGSQETEAVGWGEGGIS